VPLLVPCSLAQKAAPPESSRQKDIDRSRTLPEAVQGNSPREFAIVHPGRSNARTCKIHTGVSLRSRLFCSTCRCYLLLAVTVGCTEVIGMNEQPCCSTSSCLCQFGASPAPSARSRISCVVRRNPSAILRCAAQAVKHLIGRV
jgi:hypothetical protein